MAALDGPRLLAAPIDPEATGQDSDADGGKARIEELARHLHGAIGLEGKPSCKRPWLRLTLRELMPA